MLNKGPHSIKLSSHQDLDISSSIVPRTTSLLVYNTLVDIPSLEQEESREVASDYTIECLRFLI